MTDFPRRFDPDGLPRESAATGIDGGAADDGPPPAPLRSIWRAPRETIRRIVAHDPGRAVNSLLALNGIGQALGRASERHAADGMPLPQLAAAVLVGGAMGGVFGGWMLSHLLRISGRWIGGTADRRRLLAAVAWAGVPAIAGLLLWIPQLAVAGRDMFTAVTPRIDASPVAVPVLAACSVAGLVLGIWSTVLACQTIAEVQGFRSAWKGFGNLLLAGVLLVGIVLAIVAVVVGLAALIGP